MHVSVSKLVPPNSSYQPSKLATKKIWDKRFPHTIYMPSTGPHRHNRGGIRTRFRLFSLSNDSGAGTIQVIILQLQPRHLGLGILVVVVQLLSILQLRGCDGV